MVQAYNFLASWQLFPEKCDFENGLPPKSGNYKVESINNGHADHIFYERAGSTEYPS